MSGIPRAGLTPRGKVLLPLFLIALVVASYFRIWRARQEEPEAHWAYSGRAMGTTFRVVVGVEPGLERELLRQSIQAELERVEGRMSTYREDSEVSRFNRFSGTEAFAVSDETARVVAAARAVAEASAGAFDVTVSPLVALWGFGADAAMEHPQPEPEKLSQALRHVGYEKLHVELDPPSLRKEDPAVQIDLSAIAKGYGVDCVALRLEALGARRFFVEVGGEVRVSGDKAPGRPWRIGIEQPDRKVRVSRRVVQLSAGALATSGDYRNYYERDGQRISHTIDARTGRPIRHTLASVSVLAESAMLADAYATAINVLGPAAGPALAKQRGLAVYWIEREGEGAFRSQENDAFSQRSPGVVVQ